MESICKVVVLLAFGFCPITVQGLTCYQCLDGEYSELCNKTATLTRCQGPEEVCLTRITAEGPSGFTTSYKTCMNHKKCSVLENSNTAGCVRGEIDSSCAWCCSSDRCNYDRLIYKRATPTLQPITARPQPDVTSQCVPVATSNCTRLDLERCVKQYKQYVDNYLSVEEYPNFCKKAPDVISCLTSTLDSCYHPDYISGVTSLLREAVTSLKAQCPDQRCDEDSGIMCTYYFLTKVINVILSPGGSCELIMREIEAHSQCVQLTISACSTKMISRYSELSVVLTVTTDAICKVLPSTIQPPYTVTRPGFHTTSGAYVTTTPSPWHPHTTTRPSGLTGTSRQPLTSSQPPLTSSTPNPPTTSALPPPTESPDCHVDDATTCINELAHEIATQAGAITPDYSEICNEKLESAIQCARSNTEFCSNFVRNRVEVLIEYLKRLLDGACDTTTVTTAPPSVCDTKAARSCLVTLMTLTNQKDIEAACKYRSNATECIRLNTEGCSLEEKESLEKVLNDTLIDLDDKCTDYVQCDNDTVIVLVEGGESKRVTFTFKQSPSTICRGTPGCEIIVDFILEETTSPRCGEGDSITQVVLGNVDEDSGDAAPTCYRLITPDNWQQIHTVTLTARIDLIKDGDQERRFKIVLRKMIYNVEVERRTVCTYKVIIVDSDTSAVCKSLNDPHIHTFDGVYYNNYYQGIFKLYQHKDYPYEVQVAYQRCHTRGVPTCNCAAYIRAGDTVFVVDKCLSSGRCSRRSRMRRRCSRSLRTALYYPDYVTPGMRIYSSRNGRIFDVVLPHGTRVRVNDAETTLLNVYVYPSSYDLGRTTGLCGVYDGNPQTDVVDSSGTFYDVNLLKTLKMRIPITQSKSWQLQADQYIHDGYARNPFLTPTFCVSVDSQDGATIQNCSPGLLVETCNMNLGTDITEKLPRIDSPKYQKQDGRGKRQADNSFLPDFDEDYDPLDEANQVSNQWNMTSARQYCWDYLQGDPVVQSCLAVPNIDLDLEMQICVDDILATGETTWAPRARESYLEKCEHELRTNPVYSETDLGRTLAESVLGMMCPSDCSGHGQCIQGQCYCSAPYIGPDCSLDASGALVGVSLEDGDVCDVAAADCEQIVIYGDHFVNTGTAACRFTRTKVTDLDQAEDSAAPVVRNATLLSYQELSCPLPVRGQSFKVTVTLDGVTFSESMLFVSYDSHCIDCELEAKGNLTCVRKTESCISDGMCYAEGAESATDPCLLCDPEQSTTKLSRKSSFSCLPGGIVIVAAACIIIVIVILVVCCCVLFRRRRSRSVKRRNQDAGNTEAMCERLEREPSLADEKAVMSL